VVGARLGSLVDRATVGSSSTTPSRRPRSSSCRTGPSVVPPCGRTYSLCSKCAIQATLTAFPAVTVSRQLEPRSSPQKRQGPSCAKTPTGEGCRLGGSRLCRAPTRNVGGRSESSMSKRLLEAYQADVRSARSFRRPPGVLVRPSRAGGRAGSARAHLRPGMTVRQCPPTLPDCQGVHRRGHPLGRVRPER
jgi:hypothetical protein